MNSKRKISHSSSPDEGKGDSEKLSSLPKVSELVTAADVVVRSNPRPTEPVEMNCEPLKPAGD